MTHNENVELNDIKAFIAVIDLGSFTKAADNLKVTRGHISKQIKNLEESMAVRLITRTTRSLSLTTQGRSFYNESKASLTRLGLAIANTMDEAQEVSGVININSVGGIIGEDILTPILAEFMSIYPNIIINLDFSSVRSDLVVDKFDLIIRMGKLEDSNFIAKKIADYKISTLATPKYLKGIKTPKHPRDLKGLNCLSGSVKKWSYVNNKSNAKSEITVSGSFSCPNGRSLLNAAKSNLGIVRLPELYCKEEIKAGVLVPVIKDWSIEVVPVYALYYSNKLQTQKMKLLIQFIASKM